MNWTEIERAFTPTLAEGDGRTISGRCVPYDTPTLVADGDGMPPYMESWTRDAFRHVFKDPPRVRLVYAHREGLLEQVGHAVAFTDGDGGLDAEFRAFESPSGEQGLELIRTGSCRGLSIRAAIPPSGSRRRPDGVVERTLAKLVHVALVDVPAFEGAQVVAVRAGSSPLLDEVRAAQAELRLRFASDST